MSGLDEKGLEAVEDFIGKKWFTNRMADAVGAIRAYLSALPAGEAGTVGVDMPAIFHALEETLGFASLSPGARENVEFVLAKLTALTSPNKDALVGPVAWRWRPQGGTVWVLWEAKPLPGDNLVEDAVVEVEPLYAASTALTSPKEGKDALVERLRAIADVRCSHDMGFDRETGPIGCDLQLSGGECLCAGIIPSVREAADALTALRGELEEAKANYLIAHGRAGERDRECFRLEARLAEIEAETRAGQRLADTAENFARRFTSNDIPEDDDRQRQAVLDQVMLFRAAIRKEPRND